MSRHIHMSLSVRGALRWNREELRNVCKGIKKANGVIYTPDELQEALMDELAAGHEVLPMSKDCIGFDYKTGCPGHEINEEQGS